MTDTGTEGGNLYAFATASSLAVLTWYYIFNVAQKPKIYTSNTAIQKFLDNYMTTLQEKYWPSWFSWEGRLQSALGLAMRIAHTERLPYRRQILELKDGGQLGLDFLGECDNETVNNEDRLVVLLLPGLTSSSNTSYVKTLAMTIVNSGAVVCVLNNRGLGGVPLKTARTYCATNNEDVREVIVHLKSKYPGAKMLAIGTSLGGMTLSRYLISCPEEAKETFCAAMVISICWDPLVGTLSLEKSYLNKYINYAMTSNLQYMAKKYRSILESRDCYDLNEALNATSLKTWDHLFTAPQFGFSSWEEYYKAAQVTPEIHKFSIPVVGLNASDDPMQPGEDLPLKEAEQPDSKLALIVTERGGHLGFLESVFPLRKKFHYMERVVGQFVQAIKKHSDDLLMK